MCDLYGTEWSIQLATVEEDAEVAVEQTTALSSQPIGPLAEGAGIGERLLTPRARTPVELTLYSESWVSVLDVT